MEFRCEKAELVKLTHRAIGATKRHSLAGYESSVLVRAQDGTVEVIASDRAITITTRDRAEVKEPGSVAVCGADFFERVSSLPGGPVTVAAGPRHRVSVISSGARWFRFHGLDGERYPRPLRHKADRGVSFSLSASALASLLSRVEPSISRSDGNPLLEVALLESTGRVIMAVSTDGHRITKDEIPVDAPKAVATIPLRSVQLLRRFAAEDKGTVAISIAPKTVLFTFSWGEVLTVNQGGPFPIWQDVVPDTCMRRLVAQRQALVEALQAVAVTVQDDGGIRVDLCRSKMRLCAQNKNEQDGEDEVSVTYDGDEMSFGCNPEYLLDALNVLDGETVEIGLNGPFDPVMITSSCNRAAFCLVMPRKVAA